MAALTADSSVTSTAMKRARSPSDAAAAAPCASFTSRSTALPPASTILWATASPSPEAPPVTTARNSLSCMGVSLKAFQGRQRMRARGPSVAEEGIDHGVGDVFNSMRFPARAVVLVDDQSAHAFDEIALLEALLCHGEFHAKA